MSEEKRIKSIKTASWVSIGGNGVLAVSKITVGLIAGSLSVIGDGIDSTGDVFTSIMTLLVATILNRPPNLKFPYGYEKAETNATNALSFIIFFAGAQLLITSVKDLLFHKSVVVPGKLAIIVMLVSIIGKLLLAWHQNYVGKKTCSSMLLANSKNMQSDVYISIAVLIGLFTSYFFNLPILDPIAALLVSVWIIWVAIRIFIETNVELMDGNVEKEVYEKVFHIVELVEGVENPHRMRIRKIGKKKMINIDIEADGNLSLMEAHTKAHEVESVIKEQVEDVFDVAIHVEPKGEHIDEKDIGISLKSLKG